MAGAGDAQIFGRWSLQSFPAGNELPADQAFMGDVGRFPWALSPRRLHERLVCRHVAGLVSLLVLPLSLTL
jgi:hypothetical protein